MNFPWACNLNELCVKGFNAAVAHPFQQLLQFYPLWAYMPCSAAQHWAARLSGGNANIYGRLGLVSLCVQMNLLAINLLEVGQEV